MPERSRFGVAEARRRLVPGAGRESGHLCLPTAHPRYPNARLIQLSEATFSRRSGGS